MAINSTNSAFAFDLTLDEVRRRSAVVYSSPDDLVRSGMPADRAVDRAAD
jgi:hypothetical protein